MRYFFSFFILLCVHIFTYGQEAELSKCSNLQIQVHIKQAIALDAKKHLESMEADLSFSQEQYQACLATLSSEQDVESACEDQKIDVHIKLVLVLSVSEKLESAEEELLQTQEQYQACLATLNPH